MGESMLDLLKALIVIFEGRLKTSGPYNDKLKSDKLVNDLGSRP